MKIKFLLTVIILTFYSFSAQSQIKNSENFIDFSYLSLQQKTQQLNQEGWTFLRVHSRVKNKILMDDAYYFKMEEGVKYFLTIRTTFNGDWYNYVTILDINNVNIFLKWKKQMKIEHDFVKDPEKRDKYVCLNNELYILSYEKRVIRDLITYRITIAH